MSTSIAPSHDLFFRPELAELSMPFTTFQADHFVKPAATAQPTAARESTPGFAGVYSELSVVSTLDLDYDEPNAVLENIEVEFITLGQPETTELPVFDAVPVEVDPEPAEAAVPCRQAA